MSLQKTSGVVLEVVTEFGTRYVQPSLAHRLRLRWIFRHFTTLSAGVLKQHERDLIRRIVSAAPQLEPGTFHPEQVVGTVDYTETLKKPAQSDAMRGWKQRTA